MFCTASLCSFGKDIIIDLSAIGGRSEDIGSVTEEDTAEEIVETLCRMHEETKLGNEFELLNRSEVQSEE